MKIRSEGKELLVVVFLGCYVFRLVTQELNERGNGGDFPAVKIDPPVLDWGRKVVYSASTKHLSVENTCNDSIVTVHEAFSSSSQFVPCKHSELSLRPGEAFSLCFVFAPTLGGVSSGQLVLQTSSGGFLVDVKGFAVDSTYSLKENDDSASVEGTEDRVSVLNCDGSRQSDGLSKFSHNDDLNPIVTRRRVSWETTYMNFCRADDSFVHMERKVVTCEARNLQVLPETVFSVGVLLVLFLGGSFVRRHYNRMGTSMNDADSWASKASKDLNSGMEAAEGGTDSHLTIRVLKEKLRRRRKRRSRSSIFGAADVSSSQSGNSTPTSPVSTGNSPVMAQAFERIEERSASPERKWATGKPLIPTSTLPRDARAPGLELGRRKGVGFGEKVDKYRYDIWGDIFPAIDLMGISGHVGATNTISVPSDFSGYFVKGPHTLLKKPPQSYVSCLRSEGCN